MANPRTVTMNRILPLACALWALVVLRALPQAQAAPGAAPAPPNPHAGATPLFAHSSECVACHNQLTTPLGDDVSIGASWRSTMMANSARDPYWQAGVRRETIDHPLPRRRHPGRVRALPHADDAEARRRGRAARAACSRYLPDGDKPADERRMAQRRRLLHGVPPDCQGRLGTRESFNGGFVVEPAPANGVRADPAARTRSTRAASAIMRSVDGLRAGRSAAHPSSRNCARPATRSITEAFGADGKVDRPAAGADELPGMAAQRLQHGADGAASRATCRAWPGRCASRRCSASYRDGLSRHLFVGGNASCCGCLTAIATSSASRRSRRSWRPPRTRTIAATAAGHGGGARVAAGAGGRARWRSTWT